MIYDRVKKRKYLNKRKIETEIIFIGLVFKVLKLKIKVFFDSKNLSLLCHIFHLKLDIFLF